MDWRFIATCEYGVPDDEHLDVEDCGEPAVIVTTWGDNSRLNVCLHHFRQLANTEALNLDNVNAALACILGFDR